MDSLAEIKVPTLVVVGAVDRLTPVKYARYLAEHIPDARLVTVERAGHMVMLERPEQVVQAVREFVLSPY
jgi:pimeloyl-ACP methyl ester carboxylesterase